MEKTEQSEKQHRSSKELAEAIEASWEGMYKLDNSNDPILAQRRREMLGTTEPSKARPSNSKPT